MTEFSYRAAPASAAAATALTGRIDAADEPSARRALRERGLVPIEVRPVAAADRLRAGLAARFGSGAGEAVRSGERAWFYRTLERFLSRGAPLEEAVRAASELAREEHVRRAAESVLTSLRRGGSLAEACESVRGLTTPRHAALLRVGHASGRLPRAVAIVADALERSAELKRKIVGQLIYPAVVLVTALVCVWILAAVVVPRIAEQLTALGTELPAPTRYTMAGTRVFVWAGPAALLAVGAVVASWRAGALPAGMKDRARRLVWRVPVVRDVVWHAGGGAAAETVSTLLEGGGELLEGLELARDAAGDPELSDRLDAARARIREGQDPARALTDAGALPPEPAALALIGSRSGDLVGGLRSAAEACAQGRERLTGRLTTMINPAVMLLMGAVVGWLFYSLLAGMLAINDAGSLP